MTDSAETADIVRSPRLRAVLLFFFRIFLVLFLLAGILITGSQMIGIAVASSELVLWGASLQDLACTIAGIAGVLSFALIYTIKGGAKSED